MKKIIIFFSIVFHYPLLSQDILKQFCEAELKNKKICMVINPGNAGDAIIWYGTYCYFKKMNIDYITSNEESIILSPDIDIVIYPGGGNLVPYYPFMAAFLKKYMHKVKKLVILPHTIQGHEQLFKKNSIFRKIPKSVTVFCREKMSYEYCKKTIPYSQNIFLSEDMAFYSDIDEFKKQYMGSISIYKDLFAFRMDCEKNDARKEIILPKFNVDISNLGKIRPGDSFNQCLHTAYEYLSRMMPYETIWTDRLHVGIGAFLLGKKVHLFDNVYGKNKAVYEFSIKRYDIHGQVTFHGNDFKPLQAKINSMK